MAIETNLAAVPDRMNSTSLKSNFQAAALVGSIIFLLSLVGIATRNNEYLTIFWPANAVLVGIFIRWPRLAIMGGWAGAALGFYLAEFVTGSHPEFDLWFTATNLFSIAACVGLMTYAIKRWTLEGSRYVLIAGGALSIGSLCGAVFGVALGNLVLTDTTVPDVTTLIARQLSGMAILAPPVISFPGASVVRQRAEYAIKHIDLYDVLNICIITLLLFLAVTFRGAGTIAIPVPALILIALRYSLFSTSLVTALICAICFVDSSRSIRNVADVADQNALMNSLRLGIAAAALAPLAVVSISGDRAQLVARLEHASRHDYLTGALTRSAFMTRGQEAFDVMKATRKPLAFLMTDIDFFKDVNDKYGHVTGDQVLVEFARIAQTTLREDSMFGRFGGEEFAVIMPNAELADAVSTAMRLRAEVERAIIAVVGTEELQITLSVGLAYRTDLTGESLQAMLTAADNALYRAKTSGRNQVIISDDRWTDDLRLVGR